MSLAFKGIAWMRLKKRKSKSIFHKNEIINNFKGSLLQNYSIISQKRKNATKVQDQQNSTITMGDISNYSIIFKTTYC